MLPVVVVLWLAVMGADVAVAVAVAVLVLSAGRSVG